MRFMKRMKRMKRIGRVRLHAEMSTCAAPSAVPIANNTITTVLGFLLSPGHERGYAGSDQCADR
jgi:hypothetical protein